MSKLKIVLVVIFMLVVASLFAVEIYAITQLSIESEISITYSTDAARAIGLKFLTQLR